MSEHPYIVWHYSPDYIARKNGISARWGALRRDSTDAAIWDAVPCDVDCITIIPAYTAKHALIKRRLWGVTAPSAKDKRLAGVDAADVEGTI